MVKEEPELEEGQEAPPEPQWVEVTNSIIDRKYGVCFITSNHNNNRPFKAFLTLMVTSPPSPADVEPRDKQDLPVQGQS